MRKFSISKRHTKGLDSNVGSSFHFQNLPIEILKEIFSYIPFHKQNWFNFAILSKECSAIARQLFDPSVNDQKALRFAVANGNTYSVKKLLQVSYDSINR